jgi:citrate synthase
MFKTIGSVDKIPEFIEKCKAKEIKLWGFGHRVYKAYDPRAFIIKQLIFDFNRQIGMDIDDMTKIALELEKHALADEYF